MEKGRYIERDIFIYTDTHRLAYELFLSHDGESNCTMFREQFVTIRARLCWDEHNAYPLSRHVALSRQICII